MTPPGRAVSPLESLAPDQRAALELVLRQRRSYAELADLLGLPETAVRARARSALEALAPDLPPPPGAGELADFLLGQQDAAATERTRARLAADDAAQSWLVTVSAPLAELAPAAEGTPGTGALPAQPRALADGPAGSQAVGLMRLFTTSDKNVHFLLAGQNLPPNRGTEHYALWLVKHGRPPRWLGYARYAVGKDGALAMTGPRTADLERFPTWFATYDTVQVTDDGPRGASRPGTVILSGSLPRRGG
jgi:hypothetical protein